MEEVITCQYCGNPTWNNKWGTRKYCDDCRRILNNRNEWGEKRRLKKSVCYRDPQD